MKLGIDEIQYKALRSAGVLYLLMVFTAPIGLLYVPGQLLVPENATETAERLRGSEWLLRLGIGTELFHQAVVVFLVMALYRLFKSVDEDQAKLLTVLGAFVSVPIMFLNVLNEVAALLLVSGAEFLSTFERSQLDTLALLFLRLHEQGTIIASVFWGLWLFPFGILVIRSGFIPRIIGYLLFLAGGAYLVSSFTSLVLPAYDQSVGDVALVLEMCELPIVFWFIVRGFWRPKPKGAG